MILYIDCSSKYLNYGFSINENLKEFTINSEHSHNTELKRVVDNLIKTSNEKITEIVLIKGPGSFTGLRIGFSYAYGLALSLNIPVTSYNLFKALNAGNSSTFLNKFYIMKATKKELIFSLFNKEKQDFEIENKLINFTDFIVLIQKYDINNIEIVSNSETNFNLKDYNFKERFSPIKGLFNLHNINDEKKVFSINSILAMKPDYVQAVKAKSIIQRKMESK